MANWLLESGYSILATLEGKLSNSGSAMKKVLEWVIAKYEILSRADWRRRLSIGLRVRFALHGTSSPAPTNTLNREGHVQY